MGSTVSLRDTAFWKILVKLMKVVLIICSVGSTGCIVAAAFMRYCLNMNFYGSEEIILLFAFWLYFIGASYGSFENSHIKADLMNMYIRNMRYKDGLNLIAQFLTTCVNLVFLVWAFQSLLWAMQKNPLTTALKIPIAIPKSAIFVGFLLMAFYHIYYLYDNFRHYRKDGYFSIPGEKDYVSEDFKMKYPNSPAPTKAELKLRLAAETENEGGEQ